MTRSLCLDLNPMQKKPGSDGSLQNGLEIFEGLFGLFFDASQTSGPCFRMDGQLTGYIDDAVVDQSLRIVTGRLRGVFR